MSVLWWLVVLAISSVVEASGGSTFYVSNINGSDSNDGTSIKSAFATLPKAQKAVQKALKSSTAAVTVYVCGNDDGAPYYLPTPLSLGSADSGSSKSSQVSWIGGCKGGQGGADQSPILSAGVLLTSWTDKGSGKWVATVNGSIIPNQLWIDGVRQTRARLPPKPGQYMHWVGAVDPKDPSNSQNLWGMVVNASDLPKKTDNVVLHVYHSYDTSAVKIDTISYNDDKENGGKTATLKFKNPMGTTLEKYSESYTGRRYIIDNTEEGLATGSFFASTDGSKTVVEYMGPDPTKKEVIASQGSALMTFNGASYISVSGFTFSHTQWGCTFDKTVCGTNDGASYQPKLDAVTIKSSHNIEVARSEFSHLGQYGIWIQDSTTACEVSGSHFFDLGGGGFRADGHSCTNHTLKDSKVEKGGQVFPQGVGARIEFCTDVAVIHCEFTNLYGKGVVARHADGAIILNNHIYNIIQGLLSDKGFIQTAEGGTGSKISQNYMYDEWGYYADTNGMYQDQGTTGTTWTQNLVYHTGEKGGNYHHYGTKNVMENNIIVLLPPKERSKAYGVATDPKSESNTFSFQKNIIFMTSGAFFNPNMETKDVKDCQFDYNLYYTPSGSGVKYTFPGGDSLSKWQSAGYDKNSLTEVDPGFADVASYDFRLHSDSPAIKKLGFQTWNYTDVGPRGPIGPSNR